MTGERRGRLAQLRRGVKKLGQGAANALELLREGRLGAPWGAPWEVVATGEHHQLRRYARPEDAPTPPRGPLLLIPPLMVTAEVYDISPELSAITYLLSQGVDVWVCDFGAPEEVSGGMTRTLDDHVLAVAASVRAVRDHTDLPVHLAGYSQGGMFAYQAAAWLRGEGLASVITFGSPVDLRRAFPVPVHEELAERVLKVARSAVRGPLQEVEGLPSLVTAGGFKLLSPRRELQQLVEGVGLLADRGALAKREPRRRFLNGEGFVAWPGPAFRQFVEQMVADNRMTAGGFVIAGRTCTLAELRLPILAFVGLRDELARPAAVRAIRQAAPQAEVHLVDIPAGHFGLVVGSASLERSWPTVAAWLAWQGGFGQRPAMLQEEPQTVYSHPEGGDTSFEAEPPPSPQGAQELYDRATETLDALWHRLGDVSLEVAEVVDTVRWQLPRFARLRSLHDISRVSLAQALQEQADALPEGTFFLWRGRAYTWAEANARVDAVLAALLRSGVQPGQRVALLMGNRPDHLTVACALNRACAVGVILPTHASPERLAWSLQIADAQRVVCDPEHAAAAIAAAGDRPVLVLGARRAPDTPTPGATSLDDLLDDPQNALPEGFKPDAGLARDLAFLMFTSGRSGQPRLACITNRRWALAALSSAAAARITSSDTVYCCLPLHHATGMLVAVGGAVVGGARLALAPAFDPHTFWQEIRRAGATVAFYSGGMGRALLASPVAPGERRHPLRLLAGGGMSSDIQHQIISRFGNVRIIEFYASTEGNVALVHLSGEKPGSVGRPVLGLNEVELVQIEADTTPRRDRFGRCVRCQAEEPGLLIARVDPGHPLTRFDGYVYPADPEARLLTDVFAPGDRWFDTRDLLRRDEDGDLWFVKRLDEAGVTPPGA